MADGFRLRVLTPDRKVWDGVVQSVIATGHKGEFAVLPGHVAYITSVSPGALVIDADSGRRIYASGGGFAQVSQEKVSIILASCEDVEKLDAALVHKALVTAEKALTEVDLEDPKWHDATFEQAMALGRLAALDRAGSGAGAAH